MSTIEENGILPENQLGFRKHHGCRDAIMVANTLLTKAHWLGMNEVKLTFVDIKVNMTYHIIKYHICINTL